MDKLAILVKVSKSVSALHHQAKYEGVNRTLVKMLMDLFPDYANGNLPPLSYFTDSISSVNRTEVIEFIRKCDFSLFKIALVEIRAILYNDDIELNLENINVTKLKECVKMTSDLEGLGDITIADATPSPQLKKLKAYLSEPSNNLLRAWLSNEPGLENVNIVTSNLVSWINAVYSNVNILSDYVNAEIDLIENDCNDYISQASASVVVKGLDRKPERDFSLNSDYSFIKTVELFLKTIIGFTTYQGEVGSIKLSDIAKRDDSVDLDAIKLARGKLKSLDIKINKLLVRLSLHKDDIVVRHYNTVLLSIKDQIIGVNQLYQLLPVYVDLTRRLRTVKLILKLYLENNKK